MATGVVQFSGGPAVWLAMVGVIGGGAVGVGRAAWQQLRADLPPLPRLGHAPLLATGTASAK